MPGPASARAPAELLGRTEWQADLDDEKYQRPGVPPDPEAARHVGALIDRLIGRATRTTATCGGRRRRRACLGADPPAGGEPGRRRTGPGGRPSVDVEYPELGQTIPLRRAKWTAPGSRGGAGPGLRCWASTPPRSWPSPPGPSGPSRWSAPRGPAGRASAASRLPSPACGSSTSAGSWPAPAPAGSSPPWAPR